MRHNVCCVVVLYDSDESVYKNIEAVNIQTDHILIVDNSPDNQRESNLALKFPSATYYHNGNKNGLAGALNIALDYAANKGYDYLLTMDQDSFLPKGSVQKLLELLINNDLGMIGPNVYGRDNPCAIFDINLLITSGSLVNVDIAKAIGGYDNRLFIDLVDLDFCLKMKLNGYRYAVARDVEMIHYIGEKKVFKRFGIKRKITYHNPQRQYYIFRNNLIIRKTYKKHFRLYCIKLWLGYIKNRIDCLFYPESERKAINKNLKRAKKAAKNY